MCAWLAGNVRYHDFMQGVITLQLWWICLRGCKETIHSEKKVLSRTNKGYSAVPIGDPFEEPFLVSSRTSLGSVPDWVLPGTKNGSPMGTAEEPFWNPFSRSVGVPTVNILVDTRLHTYTHTRTKTHTNFITNSTHTVDSLSHHWSASKRNWER